MKDHRVAPPPEARRGHRADQRTTRGKLASLRQDEAAAAAAQAQPLMARMSAASAVTADPARSQRETALLAAAAAWSGITAAKATGLDRDAQVLATADKFLAWLEQ